jgi:hypothetical protein
MGQIRAFGMRGATEKKYSSILILFFALMIALQMGFTIDREPGPPTSAQRVTGEFHTYAEVLAACSPDGRWLAFEYNELNDPDFPRVGIMRLGHGSLAWHPILKGKPGRHLYVGDLSWSPDSRWLALITNYPDGAKDPWLGFNAQLVKVNVDTGEVVRLTNFPPNTLSGPTTVWLRSGSIVFTGDDENIYSVPEKGGDVRKLIDVPKDKCGGVTNTFAVSPDEQRIILVKNSGDDSQTTECNSLWVGDLKTKGLRRLPTTGLHPLNPFWLDEDTVLFSGINNEGGKWLPTGIYRISLETGEVVPTLEGAYISPFVCDSGKTLYFAWGPSARTEKPAKDARPAFNDYSGFHIWRVPLRDVLQQTNDGERLGATKPKQ